MYYLKNGRWIAREGKVNDSRYRLSLFVLGGVFALAWCPVVVAAFRHETAEPAVLGIASAALGALLTLIQGPRLPPKGNDP